MIAGTLGPVASAFSICALVRPWRQHYPPGSDIQLAEFIPDPEWLLAINGIQLAIAVAANMALLLNMTKRLRFMIAQPVTILGWYISALLLIILEAVAAKHLTLEPADEYVWSQAFYYGIYAAILYFLDASLMVITFWGAYTDHYEKDFLLTPSQRTLMLQTISFLVYLLVGALVFSKTEGWNYLDAVYWADVTLFTVGFGDFHPLSIVGRALLLPYALIGVISLGLVIGSIRSLLLDRGKRRVDARMIEKSRRRLLRQLTKKGKDDLLEPIPETPSTDTSVQNRNDTGLTEFERREKEFNLMRKVQHKSARRRRWMAMGTSTGVWLLLWLLGAYIFQQCEEPYQHWSYFDGVYLCFVSLTTIGFGDITPISNPGKSFFVFWSLLALPTMTVLISNAGDTVVKGVRDVTDQLATITILPGEQGFRMELKRVLKLISGGRLFTEDITEDPPGFLGQSQPRNGEDTDSEDEDTALGHTGRERDQADLNAERGGTRKADKERHDRRDAKQEEYNAMHKKRAMSEAEHGSSSFQDLRKRYTRKHSQSSSSLRDGQGSPASSKRAHSIHHAYTEPNKDQGGLARLKRTYSVARRDLPKDIPSNKHEYHVMLIEEIARVTRHMKSQPPRKYSFAEWAWYLKLIGEDEANAETHRKAQPHIHAKKNGGEKEERDTKDENGSHEGEKQQWSWVGSKSPLMGSQEEAEWILEKLTEKLAEELRGVTADGKGDGRNRAGNEDGEIDDESRREDAEKSNKARMSRDDRDDKKDRAGEQQGRASL